MKRKITPLPMSCCPLERQWQSSPERSFLVRAHRVIRTLGPDLLNDLAGALALVAACLGVLAALVVLS